MRRVSASSYYLFSDNYFRALSDNLLEKLVMFESLSPGGDVVASGLAIAWEPFLHNHLVGTDPQAVRDGAGNLCYDAMLRWACTQPQLRHCHLGGGLASDDALFRFKKSFGGRRVPYWIGSSVFDQERYDALVASQASRLGCSPEDLQATGYFPAYRCTTPARRAA